MTATARRVAQERSPARQKLADAQCAVMAAEQASEANRRGIVRACELTAGAEAKLAAAKKQALGAGRRHVALVAAAAVSGDEMPASVVRAAKATVADAEDELSAAMAAHARLLARALDDGIACHATAGSIGGVVYLPYCSPGSIALGPTDISGGWDGKGAGDVSSLIAPSTDKTSTFANIFLGCNPLWNGNVGTRQGQLTVNIQALSFSVRSRRRPANGCTLGVSL
jgi:hypothetical protein